VTASLDREGGSDVEKPADPGTPWQRFVEATKRVLSVSKEELEKRELLWKWQKRKKAKKRRRR